MIFAQKVDHAGQSTFALSLAALLIEAQFGAESPVVDVRELQRDHA